MPNDDFKAEYTVIDQDPHFLRVVRYMRPSDICGWIGYTALAPFLYFHVDKHFPTSGLRRGIMFSIPLGFLAGFVHAYRKSSYRFWGASENSRELKLDKELYLKARKQGLPHHLGESELEPHLQEVSARYSRYSALKLHLLPMINISRHNMFVNWDLYKDE